MKKKILLASCIHLSINKVKFLFKEPLGNLKVLCITTAANVYAPENRAWLAEEMQAFTNIGIHLIEFDIQGKTQTEVKKVIEGADIIYVTGGNTYYLMEQMQKCDFKSVIVPYLENGGFYIGCSAGAVVMCPTVDFIRDMDDPAKANLKDYAGLDLIKLKVMPHIDHPKYGPKALAIVEDAKDSKTPFLCLKDDQAVLITDNNMQVF